MDISYRLLAFLIGFTILITSPVWAKTPFDGFLGRYQVTSAECQIKDSECQKLKEILFEYPIGYSGILGYREFQDEGWGMVHLLPEFSDFFEPGSTISSTFSGTPPESAIWIHEERVSGFSSSIFQERRSIKRVGNQFHYEVRMLRTGDNSPSEIYRSYWMTRR